MKIAISQPKMARFSFCKRGLDCGNEKCSLSDGNIAADSLIEKSGSVPAACFYIPSRRVTGQSVDVYMKPCMFHLHKYV